MSTEISVVICTLDRPEMVRAAVLSLTQQTLEPTRFEVVVVDNSPSGSALAALSDILPSTPNLRVVQEEVMGLSHARNRGTSEATGEVILFMDDDAVAEPELLAGHLRAFATSEAPVATGGRIYLAWPGPRPRWMPESFETFYSGLDLGDAPMRLTFPAYPYGVNMAIRRDLLIDLGGFDVELGRRGRNLISGEEKDLFLRVSRAGGTVLYVPDAVVHHHVLPERVRRKWFLRRSWAQGRSDIAMGLIAEGPMSRIRLLTRAGLHAGRAIRHAAELVVAGLARGQHARRMRAASQTMRWLGAAYDGVVRARPFRNDAGPAAVTHRDDAQATPP